MGSKQTKGLTLRQPLASMLAYAPKLKTYHTSAEPIDHDGPVYIHAATREIDFQLLGQIEQALLDQDKELYDWAKQTFLKEENLSELRGKCIGVATSVISYEITPIAIAECEPVELTAGNWVENHFSMKFSRLKPLAQPFTPPGRKGGKKLWNLSAEFLETLKATEPVTPPSDDAAQVLDELDQEWADKKAEHLDEDWDDQPSYDSPEGGGKGSVLHGTNFTCHSLKISANKKNVTASYSFLNTQTNGLEKFNGHVMRYEHMTAGLVTCINKIPHWIIRATGTRDCWTEEMVSVRAFTLKETVINLTVEFKADQMSNPSSFPLTLRKTEGKDEGSDGEFTHNEWLQFLELVKRCNAFCGGERTRIQLEIPLDPPKKGKKKGKDKEPVIPGLE